MKETVTWCTRFILCEIIKFLCDSTGSLWHTFYINACRVFRLLEKLTYTFWTIHKWFGSRTFMLNVQCNGFSCCGWVHMEALRVWQ